MISLEISDEKIYTKCSYAPDGYKEKSNTYEHSVVSLSDLVIALSNIEYDIDYDEDEGCFISNYGSDDASNWTISFSYSDNKSTTIIGYSKTDPLLLKIVQLIKRYFPSDDEFFSGEFFAQ